MTIFGPSGIIVTNVVQNRSTLQPGGNALFYLSKFKDEVQVRTTRAENTIRRRTETVAVGATST